MPNDETDHSGFHRSGDYDRKRKLAQLHLQIPRDEAAALGHKTVDILEAGRYVSSSGTTVGIRKQIEESVRGTVSYLPEIELPVGDSRSGSMVVEVQNDTTLEAVKYLQAKGLDPAPLNLAAATAPGGGFLRGARAQEEYLARSSALYACLRDNAMYAYHRARLDPFYSDYVLYSPNVPVIRDDAGELLETPYPCSIITSPAVQANGVRRYMPHREGEISGVMWRRILKVLGVAEKHGHRSLVLGAWGCGAFGNDGHDIARLFRKALEEHFCRAFDHVVFAVTDWSDDEKFIGPFADVFRDGRIG